ncbi:MAG: type II toxin-antitoxin system HipA family toxin YjjJ [Puniceicoccales bacterium]|jgi:hypothetical protein|nr:type II toxin-antitoxin system HipA family toxin YjjJ [Puniceicoccales bacterium]
MKTNLSVQTLLAALRNGICTSRELQHALRLSQPRIAQLLKAAGRDVVAIGAARSCRYATPRSLRGNPRPLPLYRVEARDAAMLVSVGEVVPLAPSNTGDTLVRWNLSGESGEQIHEGFPAFLADMAPQGFLGRQFAHQHPELELSPDVGLWSNDDILYALSREGHDMPGAWIVGEQAAERWLAGRQHPDAPPLGGPLIAQGDSAAAFLRLAEETMRGAAPGSSAGGEQPKFLCRVQDAHGEGEIRAVIVKFSPPDDTAANVRWADLLCAEHVAQTVLREAGIPAARTRLLRAAGRTFLEVERFDRVGAFGRRHVLSAKALADALGCRASWLEMAQAFQRAGHIQAEVVERVRLLAAFASQIHNNDTHPGNLAFLPLADAPSLVLEAGRFELAPVYDMLPMQYRPREDASVPSESFPEPLPSAALLPMWEAAARLAEQFRARLAQEPLVSPDFRALWK